MVVGFPKIDSAEQYADGAKLAAPHPLRVVTKCCLPFFFWCTAGLWPPALFPRVLWGLCQVPRVSTHSGDSALHEPILGTGQ